MQGEKWGEKQAPAIFYSGGFVQPILLISYWQEFSHMGSPDAKGDWEISLFWAIMWSDIRDAKEVGVGEDARLTTNSLTYNCPFYFSCF